MEQELFCDPIEISVGTVLVSMLSVNKPLVFVLVASKTALGHTEAAAGLAALMQVSQSVVFRLSVPLMHLRNVNPYVVAECCNICLPRNMIQASLGAVGVSALLSWVQTPTPSFGQNIWVRMRPNDLIFYPGTRPGRGS